MTTTPEVNSRQIFAPAYGPSAAVYDALYASKDYADEAATIAKQINNRLRSNGRALLEVACGTGRYLDHLKGDFEVEGTDISAEQLAIARHRHPDVSFYERDMVDLELPKRYDAIICLFSSIGFAHTLKRLHSAVNSMESAVKPGGVLLVEPWVMQGQLTGQPRTITVEQPDLKVTRVTTTVVETTSEGEVSHVDADFTVSRPTGVERFRERWTLGLFTPEEYTEAFTAAGLTVEFDPEGPVGRGLFIATKPLMSGLV